MAQKTMKGVFITFEGPEGSGKSTHARLLYDYLKRLKKSVVLIREPGSTKISEEIRKILLDPKNKTMTSITEMMLYMASRVQLVNEVIKPALRKRKIVICDRFLDATIVYQGYGSGLNIGLIKKIGNLVTQGIKPDLTFLLDIETKLGLKRAGNFKDRIELKSISYHERVRRGYLKLVKDESKRIRLINANYNKDKIQEKIRKLTQEIL